MSTTTGEVTTRALDLTTLDGATERAVLDLLRDSLAGGPTGERTSAFFHWKHRDNPFGPSLALAAFDGDRLVGIRLVMRWAFRLDGKRVTAGRMVDTATHPDYRGRGIFQSLTTAALELARADTDLIFNTPNASSKPGYLKMGWQVVGVVPTSFSPVRPLQFVRGRACRPRRSRPSRGLRHQHAAAAHRPRCSSTTADVAALLAAREPGLRPARLVTDSSLAYLRWRYADGAGTRLPGRARRPRRPAPGAGHRPGPAAGRAARAHAGRGDHRAWRRPATCVACCAARRRSGVDHVATHLPASTASRAALVRAGFVTTARVGLTHTTLPLRPLPIDVTDASSWDLTLGDIEVF